ncbi:siderophore-interacting protein [Kutzneria viridogrisea]|uniref:FAD-binding 9 siderophore-interacting domain-containing protein n=2 Tax=Kutzneria TaxID=43356 RepID=W5W6Q1_9PSEU|nr:siderophore-interacting protein [Kutzneria albida]AHH96577.1 FAD-binding 9 siderophore-interacting domain-containing protein [Kutzneria albida DSM 43870]MBA8928203.1 NADPH-dependent ferric siderophore reductase [Kutzneria viridogrisea]
MNDKRRRVSRLVVRRTERVAPHMIRVVFGGEDLAVDNGFTDRYVKLLFPLPGVDYPQPLDIESVRATMPRESWPKTRTYTIRYHDQATGDLAIDFVSHGDTGLAGPWAAGAKPGDELQFLGPGGAYSPDPDADWHLLVGDEAALPAIGAALDAVPQGAKVIALIEVANASERQQLSTPGDASITWLHREDGAEALLKALQDLEFPPGRVHAFVHGEAGAVRDLRRHLLDERGLGREQLSVSGYWRQGRDEDGFQADKAAERAAAS